jgi:hypothetical protein
MATRHQQVVNGRTFKSKKALTEYTRGLLQKVGEVKSIRKVDPALYDFLIALVQRHPDRDRKVKDPCDFILSRNMMNKKGFHLEILSLDGHREPISWVTCCSAKGANRYSMFQAALRVVIESQIRDYKDTTDCSKCEICKGSTKGLLHIDHVVHFHTLVDDFLKETGIAVPVEYTHVPKTRQTTFNPEDTWIGEKFATYHAHQSTLRPVCATCNLTRPKAVI